VRPLEEEHEAGPAQALRVYVEDYLSLGHVGQAGHGCPIAALGSEAARASPVVTDAFDQGIRRLVRSLARGLEGVTPEARQAALRLLSSLVGAVVLARATGDKNLQAEVMEAMRGEGTIQAGLTGL